MSTSTISPILSSTKRAYDPENPLVRKLFVPRKSTPPEHGPHGNPNPLVDKLLSPKSVHNLPHIAKMNPLVAKLNLQSGKGTQRPEHPQVHPRVRPRSRIITPQAGDVGLTLPSIHNPYLTLLLEDDRPAHPQVRQRSRIVTPQVGDVGLTQPSIHNPSSHSPTTADDRQVLSTADVKQLLHRRAKMKNTIPVRMRIRPRSHSIGQLPVSSPRAGDPPDAFFNEPGGGNQSHPDPILNLSHEKVQQLYCRSSAALGHCVEQARKVLLRNLKIKRMAKGGSQDEDQEPTMDKEYDNVLLSRRYKAATKLNLLRRFAVSLAGDGLYLEKEQESRRMAIPQWEAKLAEGGTGLIDMSTLSTREFEEFEMLQKLLEQYDVHREMENVYRLKSCSEKKPIRLIHIGLPRETRMFRPVDKKSKIISNLGGHGEGLVFGQAAMEAWLSLTHKSADKHASEVLARKNKKELQAVRDRHTADVIDNYSTHGQEETYYTPEQVSLRRFILSKRALECDPKLEKAEREIPEELRKAVKILVRAGKIKTCIKDLQTQAREQLRTKMKFARDNNKICDPEPNETMIPQDEMLNDLRSFYTDMTKQVDAIVAGKKHDDFKVNLISRKLAAFQSSRFRGPSRSVNPKFLHSNDRQEELALLMSIKEDYEVIVSLMDQESNLLRL
jgi:hypothetical protein